MRPVRLVAASAAVLALLAGLTGCALQDRYTNQPSDGGAPSADVGAALEAVPGVEHADAYTVPWYNPGEGGLFSSTGVDLLLWVAVDREHHIVDRDAFLRTTAQAAWSINDGYSPDGDVVLIIRRGADINEDWDADARALLGDRVAVTWGPDTDYVFSGYEVEPPVTEEDIVISASDGAYAETFGAWPAAPVEVPNTLLAEGPPEAVDPAAIRGVRVSGYTMNEERCATVSFARGVGPAGEPYTGDVTATLYLDGEEFDTGVAKGSVDDERFGGELHVRFCDNALPRIGEPGLGAHVMAPAAPGFRGVDTDDVRTF
jgi:hypothetical protein